MLDGAGMAVEHHEAGTVPGVGGPLRDKLLRHTERHEVVQLEIRYAVGVQCTCSLRFLETRAESEHDRTGL